VGYGHRSIGSWVALAAVAKSLAASQQVSSPLGVTERVSNDTPVEKLPPTVAVATDASAKANKMEIFIG
jgi:hypothetical protein